MANPMVRSLGLQQLLQRDAAPPPKTTDLSGDALESALAAHVRLAWQRNKLAKMRIDVKLLECLRARREVYSAAQLSRIQAQGGMNIVWHPLTEIKAKAASAWVREILMPVGEQPWGLDPTPVADLPTEIKAGVVTKAIVQAQDAMKQAAQAGAVMDAEEFRGLVRELGEKLRDDAEVTMKKAAEKRAKRMEKVIADRLAEGGFETAMDAFIEDFVTYPAAIIEGPIYVRKKKLSWGAGFTPKVTNNPVPTFQHVSPFDTYPAPGAKSPQHGDFVVRKRFRREELYDLKGMPGYKDDQIDEALRAYSNGHLEGWLWTESERQRLEQETLFMYLSPPGVIDALSYWGSVPGWKLKSWGVDSDLDDTRDYECNVLLCGRFVLYATLNPNPLGARPFRKACFDEMPGSFWGRSIPDLASTPQQMCNAIACAFADNMGISSGPQVWVHADRFADGEQSMEMFPWKIWQLKSDPTQGVNPGIGFFQPPNNAELLLASLEKWELRADDATGVPRYTYGNERAGGSADTASGLSMLMTNAAKGLRRGIANVDINVIGPCIEDLFVGEMLYNPDHSIKGDCVVTPRGAAAILIRESAQQRRIQFLGMTANPIDAQIITTKYRAELLRETAAAMELPVDDVVPSDEELAKQMAAQQQAMEAQQQAAQQQQQAVLDNKVQIEQMRQEGKMQHEEMKAQASIIGDVVRDAVTKALGMHQQAQAQQQQASKPKSLRYSYDDAGRISGASVE